MDRLTERLQIAGRALDTLRQLPLLGQASDVERDAAIQRFEYTFEAVWKAAQLYLREREGIESGSPKGVARSSFQVGILDETQTVTALEMVDDRNLTVHTYNEQLAQEIFKRIAGYAQLMDAWLKNMANKLDRFPGKNGL